MFLSHNIYSKKKIVVTGVIKEVLIALLHLDYRDQKVLKQGSALKQERLPPAYI